MLPTYGQVRYRELWPGIDLVYRGQGGRLKYELIVKPGADPRQIRLAYNRIEGMSVNDAGDPILQTASGDLRDGRLYAYREIVRKAGGGDGDAVRFSCGASKIRRGIMAAPND
ncbi:MAG: hypothetical protein HYS70_06350 [Nitrospinae bacterium]|nr:hypothetical protein [Nitrospinota bacterium]